MDGHVPLSLERQSYAPPAAVAAAPIVAAGKARRACPRCESQSVARSRIRGFVGATARRLLGIRPYRCLDCWHRFMAVAQ